MDEFVVGRRPEGHLAEYVPDELWDVVKQHGHQRALPLIARTPEFSIMAEQAARSVPSHHQVFLRDSRYMDTLADESVHLILTSPPYWNLKAYESGAGQLGLIDDFDDFLDELDQVWAHCMRVLAPGGRLIIITGDVLVPRRKYGRHLVFPLHAGLQERTRSLGFDNLAPIIWHKIGNVALEAQNGGRFLGKPYEPNGIIKNDIEFILFQRKPGGYRSPTLEARLLSVIPSQCHSKWFRQIWNLGGASTRVHPAPYPVRLVERLIRMFSFAGDTVLDPFLGSGTTAVGAGTWGRNSIGAEVEPAYFVHATDRIKRELSQLLTA